MRWHLAVATVFTIFIAITVTLVGRPPIRPIGPGPGPACELPRHECRDKVSCAKLVEMPLLGSGYIDVRLEGEQSPETSTSYVRRDLMLLVQYAAAKVACKAGEWTTGNGGLIALGDASERHGSTPGTRTGNPRHPIHTHTRGHDLDIAYFQKGTLDNQLRPICRHRSRAGVDEYRCIAPPHRLDAWRTALFIGAFLEEPRVRVIGIDGEASRPILLAFRELCAMDWIEVEACEREDRIRWETRSTGHGWYRGHHNHMHVSLREPEELAP